MIEKVLGIDHPTRGKSVIGNLAKSKNRMRTCRCHCKRSKRRDQEQTPRATVHSFRSANFEMFAVLVCVVKQSSKRRLRVHFNMRHRTKQNPIAQGKTEKVFKKGRQALKVTVVHVAPAATTVSTTRQRVAFCVAVTLLTMHHSLSTLDVELVSPRCLVGPPPPAALGLLLWSS
jgi:hypothetical protein